MYLIGDMLYFVRPIFYGGTIPSAPESISYPRLHWDTLHSVELLCKRDQTDVETSTSHHTPLTRDRLICLRRDSNPQYQQANDRPSHSSRFYHPHNIGWRIQIIKLLIMKFSPLPYYLVPVLNSLFSNTLSLRSSLWTIFSQNDRYCHFRKYWPFLRITQYKLRIWTVQVRLLTSMLQDRPYVCMSTQAVI
jgi:hypothetical protein